MFLLLVTGLKLTRNVISVVIVVACWRLIVIVPMLQVVFTLSFAGLPPFWVDYGLATHTVKMAVITLFVICHVTYSFC